jgi:polyisoprenoid-binding protein YceI
MPSLARALLSLAVLAAPPAGAAAGSWTAVVEKSQLTLHVYKKGLLSAAAHDHHFVPARWRATASLDEESPAAVRAEIVIAADSLRDRQPSLSSGDRDKVNRQAAGPDVLDAAHHPEIRFAATGLRAGAPAPGGQAARVEGVLDGTLALRGRERPVSVRVVAKRDANGWWAHGSARFKQSDFGIEPYSGFLGTIAVEDEVQLDYEIFLAPAR